MGDLGSVLRNNRVRIITLLLLFVMFVVAIRGMDTEDWVITLLRGLSVGAVTFLVASGLSLIFGLMDVLNLAHGEMFMLGAYIGWTVFVRPDTFVDVLIPICLLAVGFALMPVWRAAVAHYRPSESLAKIWPWVGLLIAGILLFFVLSNYPISIWDHENYAASPINNSLSLSQGIFKLPAPPVFETISPILAMAGLLLGGVLLAISIVGVQQRKQKAVSMHVGRQPYIIAIILLLVGVATFFANDALTEWLFNMNSTGRFFIAMGVATAAGLIIGAMVETTMIRPLYDRPMYQLMITLGLSFITIEVVRAIWGRPEFTMPKAAQWAGTGEGCPATSIGDAFANQCSTMLLFDGRVRTYNEIFVIIVGVVVLVGIWLVIQRTRIGMVIRAGVQDSEMVEALGINVRQVFTFVFGLGVALAALGGVLAAPSMGLSTAMGTQLLLLALIALAIGGLSSYPGAAVGAVLVGLMQQFIIKYGSIGINVPFLAEPLKPSPPLVPASVVLLMVIILLILPNGLFGRSE